MDLALAWTEEEKQLLEGACRYTFDKAEDVYGMPLKDFTDEEKLAVFLEQAAERMCSPDGKVAASILMKRYAFLFVGALASWSFFRKPLMIQEQDAMLIHSEQNGNWLPNFYLGKNPESAWQIEEVIRHIGKVVEAARKASKLSNLIMWENIAIYVFWLYETVAEEERFASVRDRARADFHWLLAPEQAKLFGNYHANPLARYVNEKTAVEGRDALVRVRTTCCFNYRLDKEGAKKCGSCPKGCIPIKPRKQTSGA
ncbi:ferric iron reductase protein FhuF [Bacillus ectoiniformans]|uniref:(2Fe-2S)-binding protein n=1 Tax=Bacillus ectoiniformans TaxID=1494429 RepID=UPI0019575E85|nr:(2Fe-2S)-binding protein [Bacillus ectoiniformans]MBM7648602.1 ferric iron reductase protein FhuF [Bacillus ectoiniformans]